MKIVLGVKKIKLIDDLVAHFVEHINLFNPILSLIESSVSSSKILKANIHSYKSRLKDPQHLKEKLIRKTIEAKENGKEYLINKTNLFSKINDLAGFRIIHLHTKQIESIDAELKKIFHEQRVFLKEGPTAKTWDDESREYFRSLGFKIDRSPNLYTSVHYIIKPNTKTTITCEIQVRTLMEEVWGEVDHTINYPKKSESLSCREQIKALARATSSSSRLVDSIFNTFNEYAGKESKSK